VTSISISIVTRIVTPTYTETPIQLPFCSEGNLPCIHTAPYNQYWYDIAKINYGNGCRWPEIANSNRLPNGVYSKITANKKVYIPDPLRINVPSIVDDLGSITAIHSCKLDPKTGRLISTLPCAFEIPSNYPEGDEGYVQLSKLFYNSENYYYYLEVNNLFSGCSLFGIKGQNEPPITLFKAAIVVIPSLF
jgi:hypothetical protein